MKNNECEKESEKKGIKIDKNTINIGIAIGSSQLMLLNCIETFIKFDFCIRKHIKNNYIELY